MRLKMRLARVALILACVAGSVTAAQERAAKDDATCKGTVRGTPAYARCRSQLAQPQNPGKRPAPTERNATNDRRCPSPTNEFQAVLDLLRAVAVTGASGSACRD